MKKITITFFALCVLSGLAVGEGQKPTAISDGFPSFITPTEEYYVTRIGKIPEIDPQSYQLKIEGLVEEPRSLSLDQLYALDREELPLTVECIGNSPRGPLLSTAIWEGIKLIDLLSSLGIHESATGVKYTAADGYYASHTLEQIKNNGVLVALYMNGEPIPPLHGFPVRILNPGYYGVKQPAWVTSIEVIDRPMEDYWGDRGWDVSPPIEIDSTIFTPDKSVKIGSNEPLRVTGAAFGGTRVAKVEVTTDRGKSFSEAHIVEQLDADNTWVFWEIELTFSSPGSYTVNARATDIHGNQQQEDDPDRHDGTNDWPVIQVTVR